MCVLKQFRLGTQISADFKLLNTIITRERVLYKYVFAVIPIKEFFSNFEITVFYLEHKTWFYKKKRIVQLDLKLNILNYLLRFHLKINI